MKQPTLKQFNDKLNGVISNASTGKLKEIIFSIEGETPVENRTFFLKKEER